jgi:hypothetical protein
MVLFLGGKRLEEAMKEPKKASKILKSLEHLTEQLQYLYGANTSEFRSLVREHIIPIDDYIRDLSVDQKVHDARLAKKLKYLWDKENKGKIDELKEKLEELKEQI